MTYINTVSTSKEASRITGTIKQKINSVDDFTFNILSNNPGFDQLAPLTTKVEVFNTKSKKHEFIGRVVFSKNDSKWVSL